MKHDLYSSHEPAHQVAVTNISLDKNKPISFLAELLHTSAPQVVDDGDRVTRRPRKVADQVCTNKSRAACNENSHATVRTFLNTRFTGAPANGIRRVPF